MVAALKIPPGRLLVTKAASRKISPEDIILALCRHLRGDRGDFAKPGEGEDGPGCLHHCRLLSACRSAAGLRFWVITEPDHSITRVLLSEDFC